MELDLQSVGKQFYDNAEVLIDTLVDVPQNPCSVIHRFGPGLYIREVHIPAGTFAIGHEQRLEHMNVFVKGAVRMLNADGTTTDMVAPMTFVGKPGRKCGLILEDMIWQNIYATDVTDIDELEATYLIKPEGWDDKMKVKALGCTSPNEDYVALLTSIGVDEMQVQMEVQNTRRPDSDARWIRDVCGSPIGHPRQRAVRHRPHRGKLYYCSSPYQWKTHPRWPLHEPLQQPQCRGSSWGRWIALSGGAL